MGGRGRPGGLDQRRPDWWWQAPGFVTNGACELEVAQVLLSPIGDDSFSQMRTELQTLGYNRTDRKYLVWVDAAVGICGLGEVYGDTRPGPENYNNGGRPMYARVDAPCWHYAELHEIFHNLGVVQPDAPHASAARHCTDEADVMCYDDDASGPVVMTTLCPPEREALLDCRNDDSFWTDPPAGSYLAGHWNTANSSFLQDDEAPRPAQLTLAGAATITYGGRATLHGRLTDEQTTNGIVGEQVNIFADPAGPGGERGAGSDTTDPDGEASFAPAPVATTSYRANFPGSDTHGTADSLQVTISVRPRVTARLRHGRIRYGQTVTATGSVGPNHKGQRVYLQRLVNGRWKSANSATLTSASGYTLRARPPVRGRLTYRSTKPPTPTTSRRPAAPSPSPSAEGRRPTPVGSGAHIRTSAWRMIIDQPRVALLGYGYWGPNLARNLHMRLGRDWVACVDPDPARRAEVAHRYPWVRVLADPDEVMADPEVDALVVASPARTHAPLLVDAFQAGKHVLVEKPLALSTAEAVALAEAADRVGKVLLVGHTFEYNPAVTRMRELVEAGDLGELWYLHSQRVNLGRIQSDINALWSIGPHDVSIANYLVGSAPRWVSARGARYLHADVEDVVFATLGYDDGVLAHIHVSWLDPSKLRRTTVVGSRRMVVFDDLDSEAKLRVYDKGADPVGGGFGEFQFRLRRGDLHVPRTDLTEPLALELDHFLECCRKGARPRTDGWNGVRVVATLEAAQQSLDKGGVQVEVETLPR